MEKRIISLPKGGQLEVEFDNKFLVAVAEYFKLKSSSLVDDTHIRMFVHGATKNALDKAVK